MVQDPVTTGHSTQFWALPIRPPALEVTCKQNHEQQGPLHSETQPGMQQQVTRVLRVPRHICRGTGFLGKSLGWVFGLSWPQPALPSSS